MERSSARTDRRGEARLPAVVAVLVALALYTALPSSLVVGPRYVVAVLELVLLVPVLAVNPVRLTRQTRWSRMISFVLVLLVAAANETGLVLLVRALVTGHAEQGTTLLLAALEVWLTNIIVFGLAYWELDRGGPVVRTQVARADLPQADFRFSQDENAGAIDEVSAGSSEKADWVPVLLDYLYVSVTNSTAFSPTDTMPLTTRAKALMALESVSALVLSILVIARGVSLIK